MAVPAWTLALVCACIVVAIAALALGLTTLNTTVCTTPDTLARTARARVSVGETTPIDVVFSWCRRTPERDATKALYSLPSSSSEPPNRDPLPCHNAGDCELHYSVKSVQTFLPWVRNIFILCPRPQNPHIPGTTVVFEDEVFPAEDADALPTFNSHAVESCLHCIPGLAEQFIYFNDDMFVGKPLSPNTFFTSNGSPIFYHGGKYTKKRMFMPINSGYRAAWRNLYNLMRKSHKFTIYCDIHQATALTKTICADAEAAFPQLWRQVRHSRVRDMTDIPPVALSQNLAVANRTATLLPGNRVKHHNIKQQVSDKAMTNLVATSPDLFCINNVPSQDAWAIAKTYLDKLFAPTSPRTVPFRRVPPLLWQTWNQQTLPRFMSATVDTLKATHPDFQHILMDDAQCLQFIEQHFPARVGHAFTQLVPGAYRADLWRLCVLYKFGGVYLDIKFAPVNGFTFHSMLDNAHFVEDYPVNRIKGIYNGCMVSPPSDERIYRTLQQLVHNVETRYYGKSALDPTGPQLVAKFIHPTSPDVTMKLLKQSRKNCVICDRDGNWLLQSYPEYRKEQKAYQSEPHYSQLWEKQKVYYSSSIRP